MKKRSGGFTLIELVVVIAILGILAAVAIPKYVDLTTEARKAADKGYLAALRSATLMLYASNNISGSNVVHVGGLTNYWPTLAQVTNLMSEPYTNQYYTTNVYDFTNGIWTGVKN